MPPEATTRCAWVGDDPLYLAYHDEEWGVPVHDDRLLFEFLVLEGAQAGLSWLTILRKREAIGRPSPGSTPRWWRVSAAGLERLLADPGIVRNRLKIESASPTPGLSCACRRSSAASTPTSGVSSDGNPIRNAWRTLAEIPAKTPESERMSKDLKRRGFSFVGPTICYAHMQATGMVNDHTVDCFRYPELRPGWV